MNLNYLWIIPILALLVFVHELGHFVTARLNSIRVDEFALGFPPRLFGFRRNGVLYSINLLPIGGFVRIYGENGEGEGEPDAFGSKKPWRRMIVLSAGAFMNVVLAFVMFALIAMMGVQYGQGISIAAVVKNSPAAHAGLAKGDELRQVGTLEIGRNEDYSKSTRDLQKYTTDHAGQKLPVVVIREGRTQTLQITPRRNPPPNQGAMGVQLSPVKIVETSYDPLSAIGWGFTQTIRKTGSIFASFGSLISGLFTAHSTQQGGVAGPIGIAQITGEVASQAHIEGLMNLTALLSLNLFVVNLFPLPALDGGRLVFVIIEAIRGKKVPPQREAIVHAVGMVMLLTLMVVISFFDVQRIFSGGSILSP